MTATATIEQSIVEETRRETHRKACAYLKGYLVGYAKRKGMKWEGDAERTPEFAKGFEESKRVGADTITFAHIIYNWIRHDRPHLGSEERDEQFVKKYRRERAWNSNKLLATLAEYGIDIKEVLG
jgi:hypothetical protein